MPPTTTTTQKTFLLTDHWTRWFLNGFGVIQPLPFNDFQPQDHCFQWVFDGFLIWITLTSCSSGGVYSVPGHKAAAMKPLVFPHCPLCELHRCCGWTSTVLNISSRHIIWLHKKVGDLPWGRQTYSNHPRQTKCWWSLFIVQISIRPCSPHWRIRMENYLSLEQLQRSISMLFQETIGLLLLFWLTGGAWWWFQIILNYAIFAAFVGRSGQIPWIWKPRLKVPPECRQPPFGPSSLEVS